jgi:phosphoglycerol transferase MdoB-like AlkP superfamily enzyme
MPLAGSIVPDQMGPYVALLLAGFAVGIAGHLFRARWLIALGIAMIFLATLVLPVAINLLGDEPTPPGPNVPSPY